MHPLAHVLKDLAAGGPTPQDAHVPVPTWPRARGKARRRRLAEALRKLAADPGLYVGRKLTPECEAQLRAWWETQTDSKWFSLDKNLHVTVVYSQISIPWEPQTNTIIVPRGKFLGFETLGKDRAMVLRFRAPTLQARWKEARAEGATWSYPAYAPHLTLFYDTETTDSIEYRDGSYPPLPPFDLEFGPEVCGPIATDVFKWQSVEGFLTGACSEECLAAAVHESWRKHNNEAGTNPYDVPYDELSEDSKQVDRDAVRAVIETIMSLGFHFVKQT